MEYKQASSKITRRTNAGKTLRQNGAFLLMMLPAVSLMLIFNYLPMAGVMIAFKRIKFYTNNIFINFFRSEWVGFKNFQYFFKTPDAYTITRNTVGYNLIFITLGLAVAVTLAILLNEITNRKMSKFYQTSMMLPYFLSWVVISYIVYSFINPETGIINCVILKGLGKEGLNWYAETTYWPYIFVFLNLWKYAGYNCVIYLAALSTVEPEYYEAASIDGATKWKQIKYITLPHLFPLMTILTILALGRIIQGDFGLFYFATMELGQGILKPVGDVVDTYVYTTLMNTGDLGMSAAASLYQSAVGFILVLTSNMVVRRINKDYSLF